MPLRRDDRLVVVEFLVASGRNPGDQEHLVVHRHRRIKHKVLVLEIVVHVRPRPRARRRVFGQGRPLPRGGVEHAVVLQEEAVAVV